MSSNTINKVRYWEKKKKKVLQYFQHHQETLRIQQIGCEDAESILFWFCYD